MLDRRYSYVPQTQSSAAIFRKFMQQKEVKEIMAPSDGDYKYPIIAIRVFYIEGDALKESRPLVLVRNTMIDFRGRQKRVFPNYREKLQNFISQFDNIIRITID